MSKFCINNPAAFASSIIALTGLMPGDRRGFFLEWLRAHDAQIICKKDHLLYPAYVQRDLENWFASLSEMESLREHERVISEIGWWRDLADETLMGMLEA